MEITFTEWESLTLETTKWDLEHKLDGRKSNVVLWSEGTEQITVYINMILRKKMMP